jgi:hypothetical protein
MRKHWLIIVIASLLAVAGLSSCSDNAGATDEVSCDGNVAKEISSTEDELKDARKDAKDAEGTPAESEANDRVEQLDAQLSELRKCDDKAPAKSTTTVEDDGVPEEYALVFYQNEPGVPGNYFGPACVPDGDPMKCKEDLKERIKHDPMLLSVQMRNFKLLPGWNAMMAPEQVEALRQEWADKLEADWKLRKEWSTKVSGVLDSLQNLRIEALDGPYYTEYVTPDGTVHQAQKQMDPAKNIALVGEDVEGNTHRTKLDCGDQTVSPNPIPGTPIGPLPPHEQPPTPGDVPKCPDGQPVPPNGLCPKNQNQNIDRNPDLPPQIGGPGTTPVGVDPGLPVAPIDSPSGCLGPCPTTVPPPAPPAPEVTVPVSNGGNTGVTAPPTSAAPPAPPTTSSPTVTVVSP